MADLIRAHRTAGQIVRGATNARAGWTLSVSAVHTTPEGREHGAWFDTHEGVYLREAAGDDFVGLQNYTRVGFDEHGLVRPSPSDRMTSLWEYYPEALGEAVRSTARIVRDTPILVTENGVPTDDDAERIEFLARAFRGLGDVIADGVDVRGCLHWSALDA